MQNSACDARCAVASETAATTARASGDRGATAVEYAILASLVAGVIVATVGTLGTTVVGLFTKLVF